MNEIMFVFGGKKIRTLIGIVIGFFILLSLTQGAWAGFGITPPYFINHNLTQGSHFEKSIWLTRGDPSEDLRIKVSVDVPGANEWISIDKGNSFLLPKGEQKVAMIIRIDVPKKAEFKSYPGYIRITTYPVNGSEGGGQVAIILGARIEVDLDVKDIEIFDFEIQRVNTYDLEEGHKVLWWFSPGKISFEMEIENTGNVKAAPSKVIFEIYDAREENLLETVEVKRMNKINSFETGTVIAELPTKLLAGSYWAVFKVFKKDEMVKEGRIHLSILPRGTIRPIPKEWFGIRIWVWVLTMIILVILSIGGWLIYKRKEEVEKIVKRILKEFQT